MPLILNLILVLALITSAGLGGYLLARAHFTATIANRVLAYQSRLARANRDIKQALRDIERLTSETAALRGDLARARERVHRYEVALFEGYTGTEASDPRQPHGVGGELDLHQQATAYVQHVSGGHDDFGRSGAQNSTDTHSVSHHPHTLNRAIA